MLFLHLFLVIVHRFLTFDVFIYRNLLWFLFILLLQCYYMYCNLSHYIVIVTIDASSLARSGEMWERR